MSRLRVLGLPLEVALDRLKAEGIVPAIVHTKAPRRPDQEGAFRVVRVQDGGRRITASGFVTALKEQQDA